MDSSEEASGSDERQLDLADGKDSAWGERPRSSWKSGVQAMARANPGKLPQFVGGLDHAKKRAWMGQRGNVFHRGGLRYQKKNLGMSSNRTSHAPEVPIFSKH